MTSEQDVGDDPVSAFPDLESSPPEDSSSIFNGVTTATFEDKDVQERENERYSEAVQADLRRVRSNDVEDDLTSEHARQVMREDIEKLYAGELDLNNPPDSMEAFEERLTLRRLESAAENFGVSVEADADDEIQPYKPELAEQAIDVMSTYGQPAEEFLAHIAHSNGIHPDVAAYALEALNETHEEPEPKSHLLEWVREVLP